MGIWAAVLLFLLGLVLIVKGGDWFLDGAVWLAEATGMPRFLIGATVVSLVTTLPELTVSVTGVLEGAVDLAVSNAAGSVTANLGLILGLSALCLPVAVRREQFDCKAVLMAGSALLLFLLCRNGRLTLGPAVLLGAAFLLYLWSSAAGLRGERSPRPGRTPGQAAGKLLAFGAGISAILAGSRLLIDHGCALAEYLGVPAGVIGATMVAVGTSLPELVTTVTALLRREGALSVGNILGANVIDLTLILPVCAAVSGGELPIGRQTTTLDLPFCLALSLLAAVPPLVRGRFYRWQGAALLAAYGLYTAHLLLG